MSRQGEGKKHSWKQTSNGPPGAPYFIYHSTFNPHHDPNKLYSIVKLQYLLVRDVETYIKEALHDWNDRGKDFRHGWIQEFQCCHKTLFLSPSLDSLSALTVSFLVRPFSYDCKDGLQQFQASSCQATLLDRVSQEFQQKSYDWISWVQLIGSHASHYG